MHVLTKASERVAVLNEVTRKVTEIIAKSASFFNAQWFLYRYLRIIFPELEIMYYSVTLQIISELYLERCHLDPYFKSNFFLKREQTFLMVTLVIPQALAICS